MMQIRNVRLSLGAAPRYWFAGHRAATHLSNALNLLFPVGDDPEPSIHPWNHGKSALARQHIETMVRTEVA